MRKYLAGSTLVAILLLPVSALPQDAQSILQTMREMQNERREGVQNYTIDQSMAGTRSLSYFERIANAPAGTVAFRLVPALEIARKQSEEEGFTPMTAEELDLYADGVDALGDIMAQEASGGAANALGGMAQGSDPRGMTSLMSSFYRAAADAEAEEKSDGTEEALSEARQMDQFAQVARLIGKESVGSREAFLLRADNVNITQSQDGSEFTLNTITMWVDTAEYVPLRLKMDGVARHDGESMPMTIEKLDSNYQNVAGSGMYESFTQVMRIAGVLTPEQEAEMKEAMVQMKELETQLAAMPASQRAMMEKMIGPQLEMIRSMASGNGMEVTIEVNAILVNTDGPPSGAEMAMAPMGLLN